MIDLSNNNAVGHDFHRAYHQGGQRRLYLKLIEGATFHDATYGPLRHRALNVGFHVGAYDFLHPGDMTPENAAARFLRFLPPTLVHNRDLRPCLDCEQGDPSVTVGEWIVEVAAILKHKLGSTPVIYGSGWWLEACNFAQPPGPLWLAAYGRNDGTEYPIGRLPHPWSRLAAHQFTSQANIAGISGPCDLSRVLTPSLLEPS